MKIDLQHINLKALMTNRRYLLMAGTIVALTILMIIGAIVPQILGSLETYTQIQQQAQKLQALQTKAQALDQIRDLQQEDRSKVDQALPSEKPLLQLITAINTVAQQAQVSVSEVQLSPGKISTSSAGANAGTSSLAASSSAQSRTASVVAAATSKTSIPGAEKLTVGLKVSGSLAQINQFIQDIEKVAPITDVTSIQLSTGSRSTSVIASSESASPASSFQAKLQLSTYFFTQSIAATIEAPLPKVGAREQDLLANLNSFIFPVFQKQQQLQGGGLQDLFGTTP
jgi:Tfp pilus assembly protein PilO